MVHWWQDTAVQARLGIIYANTMFVLLGVYGWEYFQNFDVEYAIIRGRLPFRWPLIPYLTGRLSMLINLVLLAIGGVPLFDHFACQPLTFSTSVAGGIAIISTSANFMIRTWVIWKDSRLVHVIVFVAALGHCTILIMNWANIKSSKINDACIDRIVNLELNAGLYVYTMCYDLLVFSLSIVKLSKQLAKKPSLEERLRSQHILYFAVAAITNILPTIFAFVGSEGMVGITCVFAMTASAIVSFRAVESLLVSPPGNLGDRRGEHAEDDTALTTQLSIQISSSQW